MESQENARHGRDPVLPVVHVRDESGQRAVCEIGESLVPDAGHAVGDHPYAHVSAKVQAEEDPVEKGERAT